MAERRAVRTYSPEYGTLRTLLLVGAFAAVAAVGATAVAAAVGVASLEYALYGVAVVLTMAALLYEGRRQRASNPHEFVARDVLARFYEQQRPSRRGHLLHLLAAVAGLAAVGRGAAPALSRQEGALLILERLAAGEPLPAIDPVNAAWGAVFAAGVVLAAVGVDRLIVGAYRELQYRRVAGDS